MNSKFQSDFDVTGLHPILVGRFRRGIERLSKSGIPIGNDGVIRRIKIINKESTPIYGEPPRDVTFIYYWNIGDFRERESRTGTFELFKLDFWSTTNNTTEYDVYIKMLPAEVRRRYSPEDID